MYKKVIFIPVELKSREFYSKVLLAYFASKAGFKVFIGRKTEINQLALASHSCIYYGLTSTHNYSELYRKLSSLNHFICVNDEEGLVTYSDDMYLDLKISPTTLSYTDQFFAWGEHHHKVLTQGRANFSDIFTAVGSPRFDLLQSPFKNVYHSETSSIRSQFGKFVLIPTSFGSCNHFMSGNNYISDLVSKKVLRSAESITLYKKFQKLKLAAFSEFLNLIPELAINFPDHIFVIRPHPSESRAPYNNFSSSFSNIVVDDRFSIHPWILTASAVIHHYCTSSVEAFAAGTPAFALRPIADNSIEKEIPYSCSINCTSTRDLLLKLSSCLNVDKSDYPPLIPNVNYSIFVANIARPTASKTIVDRLKVLPFCSESFEPSIRYKLTTLLKYIARKLSPISSHNSNYVNHKFPSINHHEVRLLYKSFSSTKLPSYIFSKPVPKVVQIIPS